MDFQNRQLIILDIDETLIFATETRLEREPDFQFAGFFVYKRPHLDGFLEFCFNRFAVAVWSSSSAEYVGVVVPKLIPPTRKLEFMWSRDRCTPGFDPDWRETCWRKKLHKVKRRGYSLDQVVVIDDSPEKYRDNYGNLVRVRAYSGSLDDCELELLTVYLGRLQHEPNVRKVEKRWWRTETIRNQV